MVYRSELTVQGYSSGTVATLSVLPKKQAPICSKGFFHKQLSLELACLRSPKGWTVVLFRAHTHIFMICHLWRSYKSLLKHRRPIFFNISMHQSTSGQLWAASSSCNMECMLVWAMPKDSSISRYVTWRPCIISSRTASMFSGTTEVFGWALRTWSLSERRPQLNSLNQCFTVFYRIVTGDKSCIYAYEPKTKQQSECMYIC